MQSKAVTVEAYMKELPEDRRVALQTLRDTIQKNLDHGFQETMQYGMIGYSVPHAIYPDGYHCDPKQPLPFAGLASQKGHMSLYLMGLYLEPDEMEWFQSAWLACQKKLDMGKSCIRFKKLSDLPLDVIAEAFRRFPMKRYIEIYESRCKGPSSKAPAKPASSGTKGTKVASKGSPKPNRAAKGNEVSETTLASKKKAGSKKAASQTELKKTPLTKKKSSTKKSPAKKSAVKAIKAKAVQGKATQAKKQGSKKKGKR